MEDGNPANKPLDHITAKGHNRRPYENYTGSDEAEAREGGPPNQSELNKQLFLDRLRQPDCLGCSSQSPKTHGFASLPHGRFAFIVAITCKDLTATLAVPVLNKKQQFLSTAFCVAATH
jgi:hypothetical protein